jgi:hypothetical protein
MLSFTYRYINVDFAALLDKFPGVGCQLHTNFYARFLSAMVVPLWIFVVVVLAVLKLRVRKGGVLSEKTKTRVIKLLVDGILFLYPGLCSKVFTMFACVDVSGVSFLRADMLEVCGEGKHAAYTGLSIFFTMCYVFGIPVAMFVALYQSRQAIVTREPGPEARLGKLYLPYVSTVWWFDIVEMARQMLLTGGLVVLGNSPTIQLLIGNLVNLIYLAVFLAYKPLQNYTDHLTQFGLSLHMSLILLVAQWIELARRTSVAGGQAQFDAEKAGDTVLFLVFLIPVFFEAFVVLFSNPAFGSLHIWALSFHQNPEDIAVQNHEMENHDTETTCKTENPRAPPVQLHENPMSAAAISSRNLETQAKAVSVHGKSSALV